MGKGFKYFMIPASISLHEEVYAKYSRGWLRQVENGTIIELPQEGKQVIIGILAPKEVNTMQLEAFDGTNIVEAIVLSVGPNMTGQPVLLPVPITYETVFGIEIRVRLSTLGTAVIYGFTL